jgi:hypothetical protein
MFGFLSNTNIKPKETMIDLSKDQLQDTIHSILNKEEALNATDHRFGPVRRVERVQDFSR